MGILFSKQPEADTAKPVNQSTSATILPEQPVAETISTETTVPEATNVSPLETIPEVNRVVTEKLEPNTPDLFESIVESPGNKVEVIPVNVNPGADVVKKTNKKKNKKSKSV
jgi:hypothetical protein